MPTYEYVCKSCGHLFEIVQSMRDDPLRECPQCGGELRKVFAPPAIAFKGSGFYATDHGKKSKRSADTSADKAGDTSSEGSGSKKDSAEGTGSSSSGTKEGGSGSGSEKETTSGSPKEKSSS
jgi:putative FmdB family regulatory protein